MDNKSGRLPKSSIGVSVFETEGNEDEESAIPSRCPLVGSDEDEGDEVHKQNGDRGLEECDESDDHHLTNVETVNLFPQAEASLSSPTAAAATSAASSMAQTKTNEKSHDELTVDNNVESALSHVDSSLDENSRSVSERLNSPTFEGDSMNLNDRDPTYAIQRPDTLGAINLLPIQSGASARSLQNVTRFRASGQDDDTPEDMIFDMVQLGRRTRGAGMDQIELNQHHLTLNDDSEEESERDDLEESEGDDATEIGDSNQCESTEADQYKMNPEADQSHHPVPQDVMDESDVGVRCRGRDVTGNEEDDVRDDSQLTEEDDSRWLERCNNDEDIGERTEDDRQYNMNISNERDVFNSKELTENDLAASSSLQMPQQHLKQHPNSAFSQLPKPDGSQATSGVDRRARQRENEKRTNVILSSDDVLMPPCGPNAATFKPILKEKKIVSPPGDNNRKPELVPRQNSDGNTSEGGVGASGYRFGPIAMYGKTLSENGSSNRLDEDEMLNYSPRLLTSNPDFDIGSSESLHSYLPKRGSFHHRLNHPQPFGSSEFNPNRHSHQFPSFGSNFECNQPLTFSSDFEPQLTPQKQNRPYQLLEDSLELSPIRPPSSQASQQQEHQQQQHGCLIQSPVIISMNEAFRNIMADNSHHNYVNKKTSSELGFGEMNDIQEVRGHLHNLLTLSDRTFPDKANYDQTTNDVDEILTSGQFMTHDQSLSWNFMRSNGPSSLSSLHEALPLSSKYLLSSATTTNQTKVDVAGLAAENRAIKDAMEQQRFKRKHCEKQIQHLQNKVLELQQNLVVALSIDRKKDITIEQLDKALVKIAEVWQKKEMERHEMIFQLQKENASLKQVLDSQQQISGRYEMQLNHTLQQLHIEQKKFMQLSLEKDQKIMLLISECNRVEQTLEIDREKWQKKVDEEKKIANEKMQQQLQELKSAYEGELEKWKGKEKEYEKKIQEMTENHWKAMSIEKVKIEHKEETCYDLEMVLRATQMEIEELQLESESMMREKESLKVEMGLMEERHLSDLHHLESELDSSAEKKLEEFKLNEIENEKKIYENHRKELNELKENHEKEFEENEKENVKIIKELKTLHQQQQQIKESRIMELEKQAMELEAEKRQIEMHKLELSNQLQSLVQSHYQEALRLLHFNQPLIFHPLMPTSSDHSHVEKKKDNELVAIGDDLHPSNEMCELPLEKCHKSIESNDDDDRILSETCQPPQMNISSEEEEEKASDDHLFLSESATNHLSAQYSQFLASVRNFQPLLADLNVSVASVANSVSTMGQVTQVSENDQSGVSHQNHVSFEKSVSTNDDDDKVRRRMCSRKSRSALNGFLSIETNVEEDDDDDEMERQRFISSSSGYSLGNPKKAAAASLFSRILEKEMNTSGESANGNQLNHVVRDHNLERVREYDSEEPVLEVIKLEQQEQRHQQLQHYIKMLLQRSPGVTSQLPVNDVRLVNNNRLNDDQENIRQDENQLKNDLKMKEKKNREKEKRIESLSNESLLRLQTTETNRILTEEQLYEISHLLERYKRSSTAMQPQQQQQQQPHDYDSQQIELKSSPRESISLPLMMSSTNHRQTIEKEILDPSSSSTFSATHEMNKQLTRTNEVDSRSEKTKKGTKKIDKKLQLKKTTSNNKGVWK